MDNDLGKSAANGLPSSGKGYGERSREIRGDAERLISDARGAMNDLSQRLDIRGRIERNPLQTLAIGFGIGFVLGGGLFSKTTGRLVSAGLRMALLPYLKYELMGRAADLVRGAGASDIGEYGGEGMPATDRGY